MGASADEIDRQIRETREHMDHNLGVLEQRARSKAVRYGRSAALVLGGAAVAGAGVLIYRRMTRPTRREQLQSMLIDALKELPDLLGDLPDEVATRLRKPLPSFKVVVDDEDETRRPGTLKSIVRRVAPAVVGTASSALVGRVTRAASATGEGSSRPAAPA